MEQKLAVFALGSGVVGWLCLWVATLSRPPVSGGGSPRSGFSVSRPFAGLAFGLPVLVWLLSLPTQPPFSGGQGWGRGFALGGLVAAVSAWVVGSLVARRGASLRAAATLSLFSAVIVCGVPLLWMRSAVVEALLGAALGWVAVSLVLLFGLKGSGDEADDNSRWASTLVLNGAVQATALLCVATLGVYRDFLFASVSRGTYPALALAFAASIGVGSLIGILLDDITSRGKRAGQGEKASPANSIGVLLWLVFPLVTGYLLAVKVLDDLALFTLMGLGLILGMVLWLLVWNERGRNLLPASATSATQPPLSALCVSLCAVMLAYQLMQGYGIGVMLLAAMPLTLLAFPVASEAAPEGTDFKPALAHSLTLIGSFITVMLVSRIFATRFRGDLGGSNFEDQFAMFGFLAGATLPSLFSSLWFGNALEAGSNRTGSLPRLFLVGLLSILALAAMLGIWGLKIVPAFLFGLALATVFHPKATGKTQTAAVSLLTLAFAVTLAQWSQNFIPLATASRVARLQFLLWTMGGAVVVVLVLDYGSRLLGRGRTAEGGKL